jgi:hypothetical protein
MDFFVLHQQKADFLKESDLRCGSAVLDVVFQWLDIRRNTANLRKG